MALPTRLLVALACVLTVLGPAAHPARAAGITFGQPGSTAEYGVALTFEVEMTAAAAPAQVDLELWLPGAVGPLLLPVDGARDGRRTLSRTWVIGEDGHLAPNTVVRSRWAAHGADGTVTRSGFATVTYADTRFAWRTLEGDIVRVHWYEGGTAFGQRALTIGERAVAETADLLGVVETDPIDFFIYADMDDFRAALGPGTRENVGGQANADIRTLFALIEPGQIDDTWVGIVIPHELVHLVFDTAVKNPYRYPPVWLNEGLATWLSEGYNPSDRRRVEAAVRDGTLMPLDALAGSFPRQGERIPLAYAQGASAVDFLVRTHGEQAMVTLVRAYADGVTDDEAFSRAIGLDATAFAAEWLADLGAAEPVRYGPNPPPPGPLPPGWSGPGQTPAPTSPPGAPTADPTPAATPDPSPDDGAGIDGSLVIVAVLFAALLAGAGLLLAMRRRPLR
jgi:hypothetical protein